ncbi:uncharacterized protein LOC109812784 isoform X2 [Cajanus cajan]|uniref:uncharacterized protein LOC109812784 isoform X2 n=1 Tax=Cajanus cajan TaxID=3821 RepID=UPI0010FB0127|nr:uncharacterized protein LOC109812784 isoform X2 [Cajanus cajan]
MKNSMKSSGCSEPSSRGDMNVKPAWLEKLMAETFFGGCGIHQNHRKNEKNVFCLHCCLSICPHCLPSHPSHSLLQVRRYVYHDVVRLGDLEKLVDCSNIQRPQSRSCKGTANACCTCDRILQEPFHFCSLSCKFEGLRVDCYTQFVPTSTEATSSNNKTNGFFLSLGSRRKGAPHRAPLS